jgi:DNA-binding transcriptional MocR family regulator
MNKYYIGLKDKGTFKYLQIAAYIKELIEEGLLTDGEKLPSIRSLANLLNVNNITVVNAYKKLEREGCTVMKIGSGSYVRKKDVIKSFKKEYLSALKKITASKVKEYIDFAGETTASDFFPVLSFKNILNEVLDRDGKEALIYQEALGFDGLRESIDSFFWNSSIGSDNILIVSGAQQGIDVASKALINISDGVIIEKPTYSGALNVFNLRRANVFEVPLKEDGIDVHELEKIVKKHKIKCFYTMSYFQNPTGITCSLEKKKEILNLAQVYDFYIIEDDYLSELIYNPLIEYKSYKSLDIYDRVIYIKSFSKIFLPGIRIGYLISPLKFKESIQNSKFNSDISTSSLMQRALDLYINKGLWRQYILQINNIYKKRYFYLLEKLKLILKDKVEYLEPGGGLHIYVKLKDNVNMDSIKLFYKCIEEKVLITPGVLYHKNPKEGRRFFRIGFSKTNENDILHGLNIINNILS